MADNRVFTRIYFMFLKFVALVVRPWARKTWGADVDFRIHSNPLYDTLEIEGARPILVATGWKSLPAHASFINLTALVAKLPFVAPLSLLTPDEAAKLERAFGDETFRILKQLEKFKAIRHRPKRRSSVVRLMRAMGVANPKSKDDLKRQVETVMELKAHQELMKGMTESLSTRSLDAMARSLSFDLEFQRRSAGKPVSDTAFQLSDHAFYYWSRVTPGTSATSAGKWANPEKAVFRSEERVEYAAAQRLLVESQSRPSAKQHVPAAEAASKIVPIAAGAATTKPYCKRAFEDIHVTCEGDAYVCCFMKRPDGSIGNVLKSSFEEVWNGPVASALRESLAKGEFPKLCAEAVSCPHEFGDREPANADLFARPTYFELNLPNTHCNIGGYRPTEAKPACVMCERDFPYYRFQDDSEFHLVLEKMRDLMPDLKSIHIQGYAEPFWQDAIFRVLDYVEFEKYRHQCRLSTTTNAIAFTPQRQKELLERSTTLSLFVSVDADTSETYKKIRRLDALDTVKKNLRHFGDLRKSHPGVHFRIQNNVNMINLGEIKGMIDFAVEVGADDIELNPTAGDMDFVVNPTNAHLFAEAEKSARAHASERGIKLLFLRPLDLELCSYQHNNLQLHGQVASSAQ